MRRFRDYTERQTASGVYWVRDALYDAATLTDSDICAHICGAKQAQNRAEYAAHQHALDLDWLADWCGETRCINALSDISAWLLSGIDLQLGKELGQVAQQMRDNQ